MRRASRQVQLVAAEAVDEAAVALGRPGGGSRLEVKARFALLGDEAAGFAALLGFTVEAVRDGSGTADFTEGEDFDFEVPALVFDGEEVADANLAGGAGRLVVRLDAIQIAGLGGERARFEEARGPEPFVDAHEDSVNPASDQTARSKIVSDEAAGAALVRRRSVSDGTVNAMQVRSCRHCELRSGRSASTPRCFL